MRGGLRLCDGLRCCQPDDTTADRCAHDCTDCCADLRADAARRLLLHKDLQTGLLQQWQAIRQSMRGELRQRQAVRSDRRTYCYAHGGTDRRAHCRTYRCAHGGTDRSTYCGTHRGAHHRADARADAASVHGRLARLRQDGGRHLLRRWREQLHLRLQAGLLGELDEPAHVHARHRRADGSADGSAHVGANSIAHGGTDRCTNRRAHGCAHGFAHGDTNLRADNCTD